MNGGDSEDSHRKEGLPGFNESTKMDEHCK